MDTKEEVPKVTVILFLVDLLLKTILLVKQIRIIIRQITTQGIILTLRAVDHTVLQVEGPTMHLEAVHMVRPR